MARAGTTTPFWWGSSISTDQANYDSASISGGSGRGQYRQKTVPADMFKANPWGLYQVHGNASNGSRTAGTRPTSLRRRTAASGWLEIGPAEPQATLPRADAAGVSGAAAPGTTPEDTARGLSRLAAGADPRLQSRNAGCANARPVEVGARMARAIQCGWPLLSLINHRLRSAGSAARDGGGRSADGRG